MAEPTPLAYASPGLPEDMLADRIRRAVAWMAIVYGVASVAGSAINVVYFLTTPSSAMVSRDTTIWISVHVPSALLKGMLAVAGWMLLSRVRGGVKLLRGVCWLLIAAPVLLSFLVDVVLRRVGMNNFLFSTLSQFATAATFAAFPGLILLLPMPRERDE